MNICELNMEWNIGQQDLRYHSNCATIGFTAEMNTIALMLIIRKYFVCKKCINILIASYIKVL